MSSSNTSGVANSTPSSLRARFPEDPLFIDTFAPTGASVFLIRKPHCQIAGSNAAERSRIESAAPGGTGF
jgi:hypothetical protein